MLTSPYTRLADDGPSPYTPRLLNLLNEQNLKSTFFIVGSRAISRPEMVQTEYMMGHQLSIHTWAHSSLTTLTNEEVVAELGWTKKIIHDITGVTPNVRLSSLVKTAVRLKVASGC
jgi:peptidoglycan/xylan/chitin deacetylase (PgdA/CDA1 family)